IATTGTWNWEMASIGFWLIPPASTGDGKWGWGGDPPLAPAPRPRAPPASPPSRPALYVELHASSAFSFLDGASQPATLIERAAELGYPAIGLLDRDGVYGAPQFYRAAKAAGIKAIVGAELGIQASGLRPQASET